MQRYDLVGDYDLSIAPISDGDYVLYIDALAAIVAEREACAKIADAKDDMMEYGAGEEIRMRSNV